MKANKLILVGGVAFALAVIPAAGTGSRVGGSLPKQYLAVGGHPLLYFAIARLCAHTAIDRVCVVLAPGGGFVCKVFQGGTERELLAMLKRGFATVRHVKPKASRAESAELYVVALGFKGRYST